MHQARAAPILAPSRVSITILREHLAKAYHDGTNGPDLNIHNANKDVAEYSRIKDKEENNNRLDNCKAN